MSQSVKTKLRQFEDLYSGSPLIQGCKGAIIGHINQVIGDGDRHVLFKYLFGTPTSKQLTEEEWYSLYKWIDLQDIGGVWLPAPEFVKEVQECMTTINTAAAADPAAVQAFLSSVPETKTATTDDLKGLEEAMTKAIPLTEEELRSERLAKFANMPDQIRAAYDPEQLKNAMQQAKLQISDLAAKGKRGGYSFDSFA